MGFLSGSPGDWVAFTRGRVRMAGLRMALLGTALLGAGALLARDIGSDGLVGDGSRGTVSPLAEPGRRLAEAHTQYALGMMALREDAAFSDRAEAHFLAALAQDPESGEILRVLLAGWSESDGHGRARIADQLTPIATANPGAWRLNAVAADALLQDEREDEALSLLEASLARAEKAYAKEGDPDAEVAEIVAMTAAAYGMLGRYDDGERLFRRLLRRPAFADSFLVRRAAVSFFALQADQGDDGWWLFPSRKQRFRRALELNLAALTDIWREMAADAWRRRQPLPVAELAAVLRACARHGLADRGEALVGEALMNDPRNPGTTLFYAAFLADAERFAEAARLWRRVAADKPDDADVHLELGRMALYAGWYEEAARALDVYLMMKPGESSALYQAGIAYFELGRNDKAVYVLDKIEDLPEACHLAAQAHRRASRHAEAVAAMAEAETIAKKQGRDDFLSRDFYLSFAYLCERAKDIPRATAILEDLHRQHPEDAEVANFLGYLWADHNQRLAEAERLIRVALAADPDTPAYLDSLAWVLYRQGRFPEAAREIERCLRLEGELPDAVIADHAGDIFLELGDLARALSFWRLAAEFHNDDVDPAKVREKIARHADAP